MVVQYLYVHEPQEGFYYPTARAASSSVAVAVRYLECALTQAASLCFGDAPCELALAMNVTDRRALGRGGGELLEKMEALGVRVLPTEYRHRAVGGAQMYVSSRYVFDAIVSAAEGQPAERMLWLTDLDCVWSDSRRVFAAAAPASEVGCIHIGYPPDWDTVGPEPYAHGFEVVGCTRRAIGELAGELGYSSEEAPPWVGGELLSGTAGLLCELVKACEQLDRRMEERSQSLPNEEQILSLAGAVGPVRFRDLSHVARRMPTGPRNQAARVEDPLSIGLWHLPSEKGLSLRRTAQQIRRGRTEPLRRDLADPARAARRFNVAGTGLLRRLQDDGWIATQRIRNAVLSLRPGRQAA